MTRRTATFLWSAMLVVPFAFLGVALTLPADPPAPGLAGLLLALAALASAGNVVLAWVLPPRLGPSRAHDRDAIAFTRVLVSLALCEAAAIAPIVALMITHDPRLFAVLAADVAALAALFPSDRRWDALRPPGDAEGVAVRAPEGSTREREAP